MMGVVGEMVSGGLLYIGILRNTTEPAIYGKE
jgi:hypothetical protein